MSAKSISCHLSKVVVVSLVYWSCCVTVEAHQLQLFVVALNVLLVNVPTPFLMKLLGQWSLR